MSMLRSVWLDPPRSRLHLSSNATVPRPPSAHTLTTPRLPFGMAASSRTAWVRIRAPVAPKGWPSAMLPPLGLTRSRGKRPKVWERRPSPGRTRRPRDPGCCRAPGPRTPRGSPRERCPRSSGSAGRAGGESRQPGPSAAPRGKCPPPSSRSRRGEPEASRPAGGSSPPRFATQAAAAPSVSGELFPAVIVPCARSNAGLRAESLSSEVSRRGNSSRLRPSTGTRSSNRLRSCAATALRWLSRANSSCSLRPISQALAISSQCWPMLLPVARFLTSGR